MDRQGDEITTSAMTALNGHARIWNYHIDYDRLSHSQWTCKEMKLPHQLWQTITPSTNMQEDEITTSAMTDYHILNGHEKRWNYYISYDRLSHSKQTCKEMKLPHQPWQTITLSMDMQGDEITTSTMTDYHSQWTWKEMKLHQLWQTISMDMQEGGSQCGNKLYRWWRSGTQPF